MMSVTKTDVVHLFLVYSRSSERGIKYKAVRKG